MFSYVQSAASAATTDPNSVAFSGNVTAGNLIVATIRDSTGSGASTAAVTDTIGNTYSLAFQGTAGGAGTLLIYYAISTSSGACTVSADASGDLATRMTVHEFSATGTISLDSVSNSGSGTGSPGATGSITPTEASSLVFGACGTASNVTFTGAGAGFTIGPTGAGRIVGAYAILSSASAQEATFAWTGTDNGWGAGIIAFTETSGDTTAPTLSSASASATGATTADWSVDSDEAGTLYAVAGDPDNAPSVAQVVAGQDHTGSAADWSASPAMSAGTNTGSATGLTAEQAYKIYFAAEDDEATPNVTAAVTETNQFTPTATPEITVSSPIVYTLNVGDGIAADVEGEEITISTPLVYTMNMGSLTVAVSVPEEITVSSPITYSLNIGSLTPRLPTDGVQRSRLDLGIGIGI